MVAEVVRINTGPLAVYLLFHREAGIWLRTDAFQYVSMTDDSRGSVAIQRSRFENPA